MLRSFFGGAIRTVAINTGNVWMPSSFTTLRSFSSLITTNANVTLWKPGPVNFVAAAPKSLLQVAATGNNLPITSTRSVTKFSLNKGKRKSVKAVLKRFKRLHWGIWIRTHCGRHKKLFKKSPALRRRLKQHIFTNASQSWLLDKMVTSFWRRPKHYIDDPYAPYHRRDEYFATKGKTFKV